MSVFSISDLHLSINSDKPMDVFGPVWENSFEKIQTDWLNKVTDDDIVLLCGDLSWAMKLEDAIEDIKMLNNLPGKKILLKGNHDYWWQGITSLRNVLPKNFYAIQNDALKIDNYIFCGTRGWIIPENKQNTEDNVKIYKREVERLKLSFSQMQKLRNNGDKVICLMHYPPFNQNIEDTDFTKLIEENKVDAVVFGHLHSNLSGYKLKTNKNNIEYFLTSCDLINNNLIKIL
ncbi:MAG: serine/threonine protein phosphatase [Clostridiales bacterium]|nr:serine/threonine protein phosphatase [Clostridiales bacterium]